MLCPDEVELSDVIHDAHLGSMATEPWIAVPVHND